LVSKFIRYELVPGYFKNIPNTGMASYPNYEYIVGEKAKLYDNNPWVLLVFTPEGLDKSVQKVSTISMPIYEV
jgi:hypothetical protein